MNFWLKLFYIKYIFVQTLSKAMDFVSKIVSFFLLIPTLLIKLTLCLLIGTLVYLLYRYQEKVLYNRLFWFLLVWAIGYSVLWNVQQQFLKKKRAFVVKESVCVYAGPEKSFHKIFQLNMGTKVQVLNAQQAMSQILLDGQCGWVDSYDIEVV